MAPKRFCEPKYTPPRPRGRPPKAASRPADGHTMGTVSAERRMDRGPIWGARASLAVVPVPQRLFNLLHAAGYLEVSTWTLREMVSLGVLPRVRFALPNTRKRRGGECRKLLFDKADLDQLIERSKERKEREP